MELVTFFSASIIILGEKRIPSTMTTIVNPIPDGYHSLQPAVNVSGIDSVIAFAEQAFGAVETDRFDMPDDSTGHDVVKIGNTILVMGSSESHW